MEKGNNKNESGRNNQSETEGLVWLLSEDYEKKVVSYRPDDPFFERENLEDYTKIFERKAWALTIMDYVKKSRAKKEWLMVGKEMLAEMEKELVEMGYFVLVKKEHDKYILTQHAAEKIAEYFSR